MTAYSGANTRSTEAYWELSGPVAVTSSKTCRSCRMTINRGETVMCRDGRKLRFFYHERCFTGDADPRTQSNSSFEERADYHLKLAPKVSALEGPRAVVDADGRVLGREVFKAEPPRTIGAGKWSVAERGYRGDQGLRTRREDRQSKMFNSITSAEK